MATACTSVRVEGVVPTVQSYFGIVKLEICCNTAQPFAVQTTGFGVIVSGRSTTVGWIEEQLVSAPDISACQIFIFPRKREEAQALQAALRSSKSNLSNVCILGAMENENN